MTLVVGIDSSTQSTKVLVCDADTGAVLRQGTAPHPPGTEVDPEHWRRALQSAQEAAGGWADADALSVGAQQHGLICLDESGAVVRDALLWNDIRSAAAADDLVAELPGGAAAWAEAVGSVPVASFTVTKLRWLAQHEPDRAATVAAACLPHDWLSWQLRSAPGLDALCTDRSDASGTGYWSPAEGNYRTDLLERAFGRVITVPRVLDPGASAGHTPEGLVVAAGAGDNAAAALGLGAEPGDVVVSLGTSGVVSAVSTTATADADGLVAGFADATGNYLPLACTLNGAPSLVAIANLLGMSLEQLSDLALSAAPGADGVVVVPYFDGERTPNRPDATASIHGLQGATTTPANLARAAFEGLLCAMADCLDALTAQGVPVRRLLMVGGATRSPAIRAIAPTVLPGPILLPADGEYVALGAARQAAWALSGAAQPPVWPLRLDGPLPGSIAPFVRNRYLDVREMTARRTDVGATGR